MTVVPIKGQPGRANILVTPGVYVLDQAGQIAEFDELDAAQRSGHGDHSSPPAASTTNDGGKLPPPRKTERAASPRSSTPAASEPNKTQEK